jgi:predicted O-methyltransferase YrrM
MVSSLEFGVFTSINHNKFMLCFWGKVRLVIHIKTLLKKIYLSFFYRTAQVIEKLDSRSDIRYLSEQEAIYTELGLNRSEGLRHLNKILQITFEKNFSEKDRMWSEHLILFSAISLKFEGIKEILEIGTYKGETTLILSELFPNSKILTIDLPSEVSNQMKIYDYDSSDSVKLMRDSNLRRAKNVKQLEEDSCSLIFNDSKFDLIWLDGAHGYPTCTIDISNSVRLLSNNGILICDDVYTKIIFSDSINDSLATYETLSALRNAGLISFDLLRKRLSLRYNLWPKQTKFIAYAYKSKKSN